MKLVTSNNESMGFNTNPIFSSNKNSLSTNNKEKEINNSSQNVIIIINIINTIKDLEIFIQEMTE
jgi:hypothetical protein